MSLDRACVLDASALLALLYDEPGAETVADEAERAAISAVNWSEVCHRHLARGISLEGLRDDAEAVGLRIVPFGADDAAQTAGLWPTTRDRGLSLGDRACLALALRLGLPVLTADRTWLELDLRASLEIRAIR